ncbi:TPA: site-specific DNA-methyltransferase [Klebsiella variicola subsp. variicola]|uniref:DNA-methyltransferase n=1 Tax=Klebsiella pneumoniae complex TaxID=3390273 RepID=UPI000B40380B|nr:MULTISPECIES: site-specific DNA-methyltransferase [Klebsiella]HED2575192.1 site-specific DNA-methyltransferase [Klebsiella variicola subsp. variicola]EKT9142272.1 site-specific DNA-methyltransferase [Klebsiella variicola]EKX1561523.1 site-specific DNA-methyltransferase [Klebsiella pneumoniae]ELC9130341.1 site-specific DNA-methyltransferase [Klebsiella variicola]MDU0005436.1 site-specific DNA-methyltransferase [Klebsiella pneumoniae]
MKNTVKINSAELVHADSLEYIKTLPDNSLDAIITDPPYYRVKANAWDNQWPSVTDYLAWLDEFFAEFWRVLKPAGSLYVFCGPKLSSDTELLLRDRFNVLNHIVWAKPSGRWNGARKEGFRSYFPASEHIFFAEHYGAEGFAKGQAGYATKCQELKGQVFEPLIAYFRDARQRLGISAAEINAATGTKMCSHWFSTSQWQLPNERQYLALQALFNRKAAEQGITGLSEPHAALQEEYGTLTALYSELVMQYSELRQQYENLRRPFHVTKDVPHTNVWTYPPVPYYPGKHPCEKPLQMMLDIISACTRPGDVIADFFMGSGATIKAALQLGRGAIGVELEEERFLQTVSEIEKQ